MNPNNESDEQNTTPETNDAATNQPKVSDVTPATSSSNEGEPVVADQAAEPEQPAPTAVVASSSNKSGSKKVVIAIIVILLFAAAAVAGVYYWQNQQLKDAQAQNDQLTAQINTAKSTASDVKDTATTKATEAASKAVSTDLLPGQVSFNTEAGSTKPDSVSLGAYVITDNLKEAWVEYGASVDKLSSKTTTTNQEFGMGDAGTYRNLSFDVKKSSLQSKEDYYYRVAATDKAGKTIYSGVAAFSNLSN